MADEFDLDAALAEIEDMTPAAEPERKPEPAPTAEAPKKAPTPRAAMERAARPVVKAAEPVPEMAPVVTSRPAAATHGLGMGERHRIESADLTEPEAMVEGYDAAAGYNLRRAATSAAEGFKQGATLPGQIVREVVNPTPGRHDAVAGFASGLRDAAAVPSAWGRAAYYSTIGARDKRIADRNADLYMDWTLDTNPQNDTAISAEEPGPVETPPSPGFNVTETFDVGEAPKREPSPAQAARRALVSAGLTVDEVKGMTDAEALALAEGL